MEGPTGPQPEQEDNPPYDGRLTVFLLVVLFCAIALVVYGSSFESGYAAIGALMAIPASLGGLVSQLFDPWGRARPMGCIVIPLALNVALFAIAKVFFGEGAICIAIVAPIWLPATIAGALVSRWNARRITRMGANAARLHCATWLLLPVLAVMGDAAAPPPWQTRDVVRSTDVAAPPEAVWPLLISIPRIAPDEGRSNFTQDTLGIPRPSDALLIRTGPSLVRKASWGKAVRFDEDIVAIVPGEQIAWRFAFPDRSVQDHTDRHVSPDGPILKISSGSYRVVPLRGGGTRVVLTTRYRMRTRLPSYLAWWGDVLLGDIQSNVLAIIHDRAERHGRPRAS